MKTFRQLSPRLRRALVTLLAASLALNIVSLFIPFYEVRIGSSHTTFTLLRTAMLIWQKGFYILALLAVGFSGCFPFVKLGVLGWIAAERGTETSRARGLRLVAALGKWSLLDVYIVCILLALVYDRVFIAGIPRVGATTFMLAILFSMLASGVMEYAMMGPAPPPAARGLSRSWQVGILAGHVMASAALVGALLIPAIWINDWRLVDGPVCIIDAVPALWQGGSWSLAIAVGLFLVAAPLAVQGLELTGATARTLGLSRPGVHRWSTILRHWSMLDVFGLALILFLMEGHRLVRTDVGWGTTALAVTIASYLPLVAFVRWLIEKASGPDDAGGPPPAA